MKRYMKKALIGLCITAHTLHPSAPMAFDVKSKLTKRAQHSLPASSSSTATVGVAPSLMTMNRAVELGAFARILYPTKYGQLVCAVYEFHYNNSGVTIRLYEASPKNLSKNREVGSIVGINQFDHGYIKLLKLERDHRRKGYGRILINLALQEFVRRGYTKADLLPAKIDDVPVETLYVIYRKLGFVHTKDQKMEIDISGLLLRNELFKDVYRDLKTS